jgi:hypothetical protein
LPFFRATAAPISGAAFERDKKMLNEHEEDHEVCEPCREAVTRTFRELFLKGTDAETAFTAALHVLALRHPHRPANLRTADLLRWLLKEPDTGARLAKPE